MQSLIWLQPQPAVATRELAELRSADVQVTAELEPSMAWAVLFCVSTGLHLAPVLLLKGAICSSIHLGEQYEL